MSVLKLQFSTTEIGIVSFACLSASLTTSHLALLLSFTAILKAGSASLLAKMPPILLIISPVFALSDAPTVLSGSTILQFAQILAQQDTEITLPASAFLLVPLVLELTDTISTPLVSVSALVLPTISLSLSLGLALLLVLTQPLLTTTLTTILESVCFSARVPLPSTILSNAYLSVPAPTSPLLIIPPTNAFQFVHLSLTTTEIATFACSSAPLPAILQTLMAGFAFPLAPTLQLIFNMVIPGLANARKTAATAIGVITIPISARLTAQLDHTLITLLEFA